MALPTGGYSYTPQTANLGASPLSALKPLDVGVSVSFTPMPKYEVPSAQQELVSMGAAKGFQAFAEPIIKTFKDKEDEKKATALLKGKYEHEEKIAGIRAAKTANELKIESLRIANLEKTLDEKGANKGKDINYGSFEDETPIGDSDLPTNQDADVSSEPSLFNINEVESSDFLGQINPTQEKVAALWNTPLAQLTASAGTAGAQQEQALASMGAGTLTPAGQAMSTDTQPQATAPALEEPRFGLMSKFRGLYTPEEAKKMRAEFSGKMEEFSGDGKMEPVPSGVGYQFDKPMRDVAPVRVEKAIPAGQASQATAKPTRKDLNRYIQNWSDPSVAASAVDKIAEIMGSEYAYPELIEIKDKNQNVIGYRPSVPKRLTGKELAELKTGKKEKLQQFQLQSFENVNRAQATLSDLAKQLEKVQSKMGPISGNLLKRNPYDEDVQLLQNYMTALIPTIARGVYGEVGVLTQADIDNYSKLIPNITQSPSLAKSTLEFLSKDIERAKNNKFDIWESTNYDVEGLQKFVKTKPSNEENLSDQAAALAKQLSTLPKGSPEEAKARQDLIVIRGKIVEANNAGK